MACSVKVADEARDDLAGILEYLINTLHAPRAAQSFLADFDSMLDRLAEFPESLPYVADERLRELGYSKALVKKYVVLYRQGGGTVYVVHVFHSSQDYARLV